MSEKESSYERAYAELVDYMIDSCTSTVYSDDLKHAGFGGGFVHVSSLKNLELIKGDLIRLGSAFNKEFRLSWYHEERKHYYKDEDGTFDEDRWESEYLLQSVKTGKFVWWSNVSLAYFDREELALRHNWKWNDRQFEFNDKWTNLCYKEKNAYITLPIYASFGEGYEVTIGTRTRFAMDDYKPTKTFPDYRKVTKKMLSDFYDECVNNRSKKD